MKVLVCTVAASLMIASFPARAADATTDSVVRTISALAEQGNSEAIYYLGMFYNNGMSVPADQKKAFELFERAAAAGHPLAHYKLGCYWGGQFPGVVPLDHDKELQHKLIAAEAGYALAQGDVGNIYYKQNRLADALQWWEVAARQGYPQSLYNLSGMHGRGEGTPKDLKLAYAYLKLAKLQSEGRISPRAQQSLDELKASMSPKDVEEAEWIVADFKSRPTPLTQQTRRGFNEVRRFAAANGK